MIKVVVVDDEPAVRQGLVRIIDAQHDMTVIAQAADGEQAVAAVVKHEPQIMLMDIRMPGLDGLRATEQIAALLCRTRVIVLTTFDLDDYVHRALRAGASGFLLKRARAEELLAAIRTVNLGDAILDPGVTRRLIEQFSAPEVPAVDLAASYGLTEREIDVLAELAGGETNAAIATRLEVSEHTVKTHLKRIMAKTGCRSRVQAVVFAYDTGLTIAQPRKR